ncbi:MAG TPA: STAS domain-containing protein [Pseudonocardiaceae bacterium]|jgi:anti-anti-sigma factor|nr:STAS domain-containing protein [Pseudonocardiaceae bacterium]
MTTADVTGGIHSTSTWTDHRTGRDGDCVLVVHLHGEFDEATGVNTAELVRQALAQRPAALVLDLTEVDFVGSAALSVLVDARRRADEAGIALGVVAARRVTLLPLELTGLTRVFAVFSTVRQALAELRGKDTGALSA